jgi:hypothetical protein
MREAFASAAMLGMVAASLALAGGAASGPSVFVRASHDGSIDFDFPGWVAGPLAGTMSGLSLGAWILLSALMYALYLVVVALSDSVRRPVALAAIGVAHLVFFLGPPLWLTDAYNYLGFARLGAVHGLDPYAHALSAARSDPVYAYSTWKHIATPYGPLFTLASYGLAPLGLATGLWTLKALIAAASLGCVAVVGRLARELGRPATPAMLLVGLNPLWLIYGIGGAHNDALMMLLLLSGLLLVVRGREALGAGAVVAAAGVKVTAGLALPFAWLASRRRWRALAGAALALVLVAAVSAVAFGDALTSALLAFLPQGQLTSLRSFPGQITDAILEQRTVAPSVRTAALVSFGVVAAALIVRAWRRGDWVAHLGWVMLSLLLTLTWVMPWYVVWLLPFAALSQGARLRQATLALGLFLLIVRLPYAPIP